MWWHLKIVRPKPQPNKNIKIEANKKMPNRITFAKTAADSEKMQKSTTPTHLVEFGKLWLPKFKIYFPYPNFGFFSLPKINSP